MINSWIYLHQMNNLFYVTNTKNVKLLKCNDPKWNLMEDKI